jgi:hypothetical protein
LSAPCAAVAARTFKATILSPEATRAMTDSAIPADEFKSKRQETRD